MRSGGAIRTAGVLEYLAGRYDTDGIFFRQAGERDPREALPGGLVRRAMCVELPRHGRSVWERGIRNLGRYVRNRPPLVDRFAGFEDEIAEFVNGYRYDVAVVEHFWCAPYGRVVNTERRIADLHNIESEWHARMAGVQYSWVHRRFAAAYKLLEQQILPGFDLVLTASEADRAKLPAGVRAVVYPNTVPLRAEVKVEKRRQVVFSANFEYEPNRAAVAWFAREVWPRVKRENAGVEWVLAGRGGESVREFLGGDERVRVTGEKEDLTAEIAQAQAAIVPLQAGSGTRIKILEAWAAGTAVVSTTLGAEGLPLEGVYLADDAEAFANGIARVLREEGLRRNLEKKGRETYLEKFTWPAGWAVLEREGI